MNERNSTGSYAVRIRKNDYFRLPAEGRCLEDGPMVLSMLNGRQTFVPAIIID